MDHTLVICKPDAVERSLIGEIINRIERRGLKIVAAQMCTIAKEDAQKHYQEHEGKPFFDDIVSFITRGPAMVMVVEGPAETYKVVRELMGATNPKEAAAGTIRGDLAEDMPENLVHGSDSLDSAEREIGIFFPELR